MTQAFNLSQLANNLDSSGRLDATDGLVNAIPVANGGTGASSSSAARTNLDAPSTSGSGATGTWPISISGNSAYFGGQLPAYYQTALGFTPVQQSGGAGQLSNKVYIGWSGTQLKAQVDSTDMGAFTMNSFFTGSNQSVSGANGYQKLPGGLILQWGSYDANAIDDRVVTLPIAFPNAGLSCSHTFNQPSGVSTFARFDNNSTITLTTGVFYSSGNPAGKHYWMAIGY